QKFNIYKPIYLGNHVFFEFCYPKYLELYNATLDKKIDDIGAIIRDGDLVLRNDFVNGKMYFNIANLNKSSVLYSFSEEGKATKLFKVDGFIADITYSENKEVLISYVMKYDEDYVGVYNFTKKYLIHKHKDRIVDLSSYFRDARRFQTISLEFKNISNDVLYIKDLSLQSVPTETSNNNNLNGHLVSLPLPGFLTDPSNNNNSNLSYNLIPLVPFEDYTDEESTIEKSNIYTLPKKIELIDLEILKEHIIEIKENERKLKLQVRINKYMINILNINKYPILANILLEHPEHNKLVDYLCVHFTSDEIQIFSKLLSQLNEDVLEFLLKSFNADINNFRVKRKIWSILKIENESERKQAFKKYIMDIYTLRECLKINDRQGISDDVIKHKIIPFAPSILNIINNGWTNRYDFNSQLKRLKYGLIYKTDRANVFNIIERLRKKKKISNILKKAQEEQDFDREPNKNSRKRKERKFSSQEPSRKKRKIEKSDEQIIKEKIEELETIQDIKTEGEWLKFLENIEEIRKYLEQETGWHIPYIEVIRAFPNLKKVFIKEKDNFEYFEYREEDTIFQTHGKRKARPFSTTIPKTKRRKLKEKPKPIEIFLGGYLQEIFEGGPICKYYGRDITFVMPPLLEELELKTWKIFREQIKLFFTQKLLNKIMRDIRRILKDVKEESEKDLYPDNYRDMARSV
ncbi:hypothetical protein ACFL5N_02870, partial [bacterium]